MEGFDREKAARVWQRVQDREPVAPVREDPEPMLRTLGELAALYDALAGLLTGRAREQVRQLAREARSDGACIRGILIIQGRSAPPERSMAVSKELPRRWLEKCSHRERRLMEEGRKRSFDPDWGRMYGRLGDRAEARWQKCLTLLGWQQP